MSLATRGRPHVTEAGHPGARPTSCKFHSPHSRRMRRSASEKASSVVGVQHLLLGLLAGVGRLHVGRFGRGGRRWRRRRAWRHGRAAAVRSANRAPAGCWRTGPVRRRRSRRRACRPGRTRCARCWCRRSAPCTRRPAERVARLPTPRPAARAADGAQRAVAARLAAAADQPDAAADDRADIARGRVGHGGGVTAGDATVLHARLCLRGLCAQRQGQQCRWPSRCGQGQDELM